MNEFKKYLNETEDEYNESKEQLRLKIEKNTDIKNKLDDLQKKKEEALVNYENSLDKNFNAIKQIGTYESNLKEEIIDFVSGLDDMQLPEAEARVFFEALIKEMFVFVEIILTMIKETISKMRWKASFLLIMRTLFQELKIQLTKTQKKLH